MSTSTLQRPTTQTLCPGLEQGADPDQGRSFQAAIKPTCARPDETVDGEAEIVYVDGEASSVAT